MYLINHLINHFDAYCTNLIHYSLNTLQKLKYLIESY